MASTRASREVEVGDRLPAKTLTAVKGEAVNLHRTRHDSSLLVFPHPSCGECRAYLRHLGALASELADWGGRPVVAVADELEARAMAGELALAVLIDQDASVRTDAGIATDDLAVLVADRFGMVYRSERPGPEHRFPSDEDLVGEARYVGTQCPECGVPDDPLAGEESWAR